MRVASDPEYWFTDQQGHKWPVDPDGSEGVSATALCVYCRNISGSLGAAGPCPRSPARSAEVNDLASWWSKVSAEDGAHAMRKAEEYGSADLEIMGKAMESLYSGNDELDPESRRRVGIEMAIAFYNLGKAARMFGAYAKGQVPSDDTWHDATVYPMMARRVREQGQWP